MVELQSVLKTNPRWSEHPADEWSDAIVASMKLGGVNQLFFVSGTEIIFYQEAIAKAKQRGLPAPDLITVPHEHVALNAALGAAAATGQPSAVAVHVDVGTLNTGAAIHTAWKGSYPVLITAGNAPRAYPGTMPGARDGSALPDDPAAVMRRQPQDSADVAEVARLRPHVCRPETRGRERRR